MEQRLANGGSLMELAGVGDATSDAVGSGDDTSGGCWLATGVEQEESNPAKTIARTLVPNHRHRTGGRVHEWYGTQTTLRAPSEVERINVRDEDLRRTAVGRDDPDRECGPVPF